MVRTAVAAIALGATVAVALDAKECCTNAQAQTQTASPESTIWDHNGSVMYLVAKGSSREFYYQKPRPGMLDAGARPGSLLFRGEIDNGQYSGTAYIFNPHCGQIPFQVKGSSLDNDERIMLTGQAPRVGQNCRTYESYTSKLEFRRLKPNEVAQSQEPFTAAQAPAVGESKPEVPSRDVGELPSAPTAQSSVTNEAPSATQDSSSDIAKPEVSSTPTARTSVTNELVGAKDLDKYKWAAAFIVIVVWVLILSFGRILIRRKG
jgi:hypothetical protein